MRIFLNDNWKMKKDGSENTYICDVPCSVYKTLISEKVIPDPYYRENEYISTSVCDYDYDFEKSFNVSEADLQAEKVYLRFDGIDTISDIFLNGEFLSHTNNMHRIWEFEVKDKLKAGENTLLVKIKSPNRYIEEMDKKRHLWGVDSTMKGYTHIRKAHCMFGWDWGPKLPDIGIWRDVSLNFYSGGKINSVYYSQKHESGKVILKCSADIEFYDKNTKARLKVFSPDGQVIGADVKDGTAEIVIERPQLWWVNGFGGQPLYNCIVELFLGESILDSSVRKIGLRTLTISQEKDQWGEEFCFVINGKKIFAMGANYIPEDQIVTRCTEEKTRRLLDECKKANYNFIRAWGGGCYPDEYFYDWCDENGFIVWQDFMFACSAYLLTDEFKETVEKEIADNIIRLRNHASLGLWCGNNEIESAWEYWGLPEDQQAQQDYLVLFEEIIPKILSKLDPETFYWPSSPSSGGGFKDASSNHAGDMHYWNVWHCFKPIEAFREFYYRFCSEYGFEALPDIKTIRTFADESLGDFDLCSPVMEAHQKCAEGNEKIMFYLAQMVNYPYDFERLIYCSQLVQADCIRSNVEHMRRARGRCMGSAYWQVNDSNPVISWSSIDYFDRWKGLHYYAKRFYAPCLLSADDSDCKKPVLNISNETFEKSRFAVSCRLRNNKAEILSENFIYADIAPLSAENVLELDLSDELADRQDMRTKYLEYTLEKNGEIIGRGTTLFVRPKEFQFLKPEISVNVTDNGDYFSIELSAQNYAKSVCLSLNDSDCVFSDNWFDIHGNESVAVAVKKDSISQELSLDEFKEQLKVISY